jgi:DNA-binding MarR family transcriptional regulator
MNTTTLSSPKTKAKTTVKKTAKKKPTTKASSKTRATPHSHQSAASKAKSQARHQFEEVTSQAREQFEKVISNPTPRQLSEGLYNLATGLAQRSGTATLTLLEERKITPAQLRALLTMAEEEAPIAVSQLAEKLSLSLSTVSRVAENLINRGLLESTVSTVDRRGRDLSLTKEGQELVKQVAETRISDLWEVVVELTHEQKDRLAQALSTFSLLR